MTIPGVGELYFENKAVHLLLYRAGSIELGLGEVIIRKAPYYRVLLGTSVHLYGYPVGNGVRNRWAFIQFGSKTCWLRRY